MSFASLVPILRSAALAAVANAGSLALAAWLFDGFDVRLGWFVLAVVVYTAVGVALRRLVGAKASRWVRASTIAGGLVLTFVALLLTDLAVPERGFDIDGWGTWIGVTLIVWAAGVAYGEVDTQAPADAPAVQ